MQEVSKMLMETWNLYGLSLNKLTFSGEVGYVWKALGATAKQLGQYRLSYWFSVLKTSLWLLLSLIFFSSGETQAALD